MRWILLTAHADMAVGIQDALVRENVVRGDEVRDLRGIQRFAVLSSKSDSGQQHRASDKSDKCFHSFSKGGTLILRQRVWLGQMEWVEGSGGVAMLGWVAIFPSSQRRGGCATGSGLARRRGWSVRRNLVFRPF